jgi:hypothetical protein
MKAAFISLAVASLLAGSSIYVLFRPTSLLMFHWFDAVGLMHPVEVLRQYSPLVLHYLPTSIIYSAPFALWVFSYLLCVEVIWWRSGNRWCYVWALSVPIISIISEFCQLLHVLSGTFDPEDLLAVGLATVSGLGARILVSKRLTQKGEAI